MRQSDLTKVHWEAGGRNGHSFWSLDSVLELKFFLKNKVKLGLCLRNVVTGGVSQWA